MTAWRRVCFLAIAMAGCHTPSPVSPRAALPSVAPVSLDLPLTTPTAPVLDGKGLANVTPRPPSEHEGKTFRRLTESDCVLLAAANTGLANLIDDEHRVPVQAEMKASFLNHAMARVEESTDEVERFRRTLRYHAALEARNGSAAAALNRFFQLTEAEVRTDLLRKAFPIIDALIVKAQEAKKADVRFPLDPADLARERLQMVSQLEQAELGSRLLNIDLKRRLALPSLPMDERLWPVGDFAIDPAPVDPETSVKAALADRPELRGWRALYQGLTPATLPDVRDILRAGSSLLSPSQTPVFVRWFLRKKPGADAATLAEVEVRRKQIYDVIVQRERDVADETRAAAMMLNAQTVRATLARDRLRNWTEKLDDAVKKKEAKQPGAEFVEPQVRVEWLKAQSELASEVAAWHQARVRLKAAEGWLAWEAVPAK
jgi:hypothetical protein